MKLLFLLLMFVASTAGACGKLVLFFLFPFGLATLESSQHESIYVYIYDTYNLCPAISFVMIDPVVGSVVAFITIRSVVWAWLYGRVRFAEVHL